MALEKVLILDDEPLVCAALKELLVRQNLAVVTAGSIAEARTAMSKESFDLVFCDLRLPDGSGEDFQRTAAEQPACPLFVIMTGFGSIESAVGCMRAGAFDYLIKPFSIETIQLLMRKAESFSHLVKVNRFLSEGRDESEFVGDSPAIRQLRVLIGRVAPTNATVLITGESGTGKEMVARELYRQSQRKNAPFIRVNCAALSETLMESEFFGHEKGAFTGANDRREGRFELANGGTLLLDEISEIPLNLQAKLLRVLQEREFERVGGNRTIKTNIRVLATSNRDLLKEAEEGRFRQDLYYRLSVFPIHVPPLRERGDDVLLLAETFLRRFAKVHGVNPSGWSPEALAAMRAYPWRGNVRELQNTVERAVILGESGRPIQVSLLSLPVDFRSSSVEPWPLPVPQSKRDPARPAEANGVDEPPSGEVPVAGRSDSNPLEAGLKSLEEFERVHILETLRHTSGSRKKAAEILGITDRTLRNKLALYRNQGIEVPGFVENEDE